MHSQKFFFTLIILLAIFFRFNNLNWDSDQHLHPDERFLTMVNGAMKIPQNILDYFDPKVSTLNPVNIGYKFYVYGVFPGILNKLIAVQFGNDTYNDLTIQGRFLSALADLLVVLLIYKTVQLFEKKYNLNKSIKYWSSFFYAIAVFPIQQAHFFTVDTFLNLFSFASFYYALKFYFKCHYKLLIISAIFFGLALASKVSAIYILPLNIIFILIPLLSFRRTPMLCRRTEKSSVSVKILFTLSSFARSFTSVRDDKKIIVNPIIVLFFFFIMSYLTLRFANPYYFESANFFNPTLNNDFISSIKSLEALSKPEVWFPPAVQWISKLPIIFSLNNLILFGVGIPYFVLILCGVYSILRKYRSIVLLSIIFWALGFFLYQSSQFAKTMRYFILIYPFLAIFAGFGVYLLFHYVGAGFSRPTKGSEYPTPTLIKNVIYFTLIILLLTWPLAFSSIYFHKHSRVEASEWIYKNIHNNAIILSEYWDDPLPLFVKNNYGKNFRGEALTVFDYDTPEKWQKMNTLLAKADYYILSSNRGWGSIMTVPEKYPKMSKFYKDLLNDKLNYKKIKEFTSYPSLKYLGIPIDFPDDFSDESFTVYDHPKVMIFKKENDKKPTTSF